MHIHMMMSECPTENHVSRFARIFWGDLYPTLKDLRGFHRADLLLESGGYMVVVLIAFTDEADDSALSLERFIAQTKDLLVWRMFVRVFQIREGSLRQAKGDS